MPPIVYGHGYPLSTTDNGSYNSSILIVNNSSPCIFLLAILTLTIKYLLLYNNPQVAGLFKVLILICSIEAKAREYNSQSQPTC